MRNEPRDLSAYGIAKSLSDLRGIFALGGAPLRLAFVTCVGASIVGAGLDMTNGLLLEGLVNVIRSPGLSTVSLSFFPSLHISQGVFLLVFLGASFLRQAFAFLSSYFFVFSRETLVSKLKQWFTEKLFHSVPPPLSSADVHTLSGELIPKTGDCVSFIVLLVSGCFQLGVILVSLFYYTGVLAFVGILALGFIGILVKLLDRLGQEHARTLPKQNQKYNFDLEQFVKNWIIVKILRNEQSEYTKLQGSIVSYEKKAKKLLILTNLSTVLPALLGTCVILFIVFLQTKTSWMDSGKVLFFVYGFYRMSQTLSSLANTTNIALNSLQNVRMVAESIDYCNRVTSAPRSLGKYIKSSSPVPATPPSVSIRSISYSFDMSKVVFDGFSLTVPAGSICGIFGTSGSGKSTLFHLILGLLDPQKGEISIDGLPPLEYFSKHEPPGYVGPDPFLISGSLRENLSYGLDREVTDSEIWSALQDAGASDFVKASNEGLALKLDAFGMGLSTGQKQRISLARALLRKPKLLFLDEASANLDEVTESSIAQTIAELRGTCTTFIISHRKEMLKYSDLLIELKPS